MKKKCSPTRLSDAYETIAAQVPDLLDAGVTWSEFESWLSPLFGAVLREGRVDGWVKPKPWPYDSAKAQAALHGKKRK